MLSSLLVWLARSCGVGHELAARIDSVEWHWARPDLLIIGLLLLVPAGWWIARRHRERMPWLSPRQRHALSACRIAVLALLVFVLAGPSLRLDERVEEKPVVALIVDTSDSMQLPVGRLPAATIDGVATAAGLDPVAAGDEAAAVAPVEKVGRWSRGELVRAVLTAQADTTLRQLADQFDLRRYEVARRVRRVYDAAKPAGGATPQPPLDPFDTALGVAVEMAMDDASGRGLAGIVLVTDGRSTVGIDPLDAVRRATEASGGQPRAPVIAVPVGSIDAPIDLAVTDVLAAPVVALNDTVSINATLQSSGLASREVAVELRSADGEVLESRRMKLKDGRQQVVFQWHAKEAGTSLLTVAVPPAAEEAVRENNLVETSIIVSDRRSKVLVVDHAARWDLRFIDHAIRRDTGFEPTVLLTSTLASADATTDTATAGDGDAGAKLPRDVEEWAAYDLIVLGDVPAAVLDVARQKALVEAVSRRGVGLVLQPGGEHLPREYADAPLAELFPVTIDQAAGDGSATVEAAAFKPLRMQVTARGAMHPAFALSGDAARNRSKWSEMPPFFRAAAATGPKPSATVLAEVDAPASRAAIVLMAEAPVGNGRVVWIGTDETFRWRRNVGDSMFWRFWGQALRSAARRDDHPPDANWLVVTPDRCEPDSPVLVELNLVDESKKPVEAAVQKVALMPPGAAAATVLELRPAGRPGLYAGSFTPDSAGRHGVRHGPAAAGLSAGLSAECVVSEPSRERAQAGVDREALRSLADLSGGAVIEVADFSTIPYKLTKTAVEARTSLEDEIWDTWPVLLLLVGLYCLDVGIRRLSGSS
ncbi:MAG: hypothetical protein NTY17_08885 [Planctomycetia bacterium]|nr:hypothetical protein [Planctomycetia bacterium]